jgi:hypothetical protein
VRPIISSRILRRRTALPVAQPECGAQIVRFDVPDELLHAANVQLEISKSCVWTRSENDGPVCFQATITTVRPKTFPQPARFPARSRSIHRRLLLAQDAKPPRPPTSVCVTLY